MCRDESARSADASAARGHARPAGLWTAFVRRHLFDYPPAARRTWLVLVLAGFAALGWAIASVSALPADERLQVIAGCTLVGVASLFPLHLPRTRYQLCVADVFVLLLLGLHGPAAATLAAAAEGAAATLRNTRRLSSRLGTTGIYSLGMLLAGGVAGQVSGAVRGAGLSPEAATMAALAVSSLPLFAGCTLPMLALMALKQGRLPPLRRLLADWMQDYAWLAGIYIASGLLAGLLVANAHQFGRGVIVVAALSAAALVVVARVSIRRHETQRQHQEGQVTEARREAEVNQQRFMAAFTHAAVGMAIVQPDRHVRQVNLALCRLLGRTEAALVGLHFDTLLHPADAAQFHRRVQRLSMQARPTLAGDLADAGDPGDGPGDDSLCEAFSMELRCRGGSGEHLWVSLHGSRFNDPGEATPALIFQLHDITSRRLAEERLHHTAYHDSLTDLPNRRCFNERLAAAVELSSRDAAQGFAVIFLDLDRFKTVNDSLGHVAGNLLLCAVARRLGEGVRPGDLVARLGGDEFAVLAERVEGTACALQLAERLHAALQQPLTISGTEVQAGASVGVTVSDLGYRSADEVLRDADLAMYAAKAAGRGRVMLFDQSMHARAADRLQLESDLRRAIGDGQLSLAFQPLYDLAPYRLSGFEALARWVHPERGPISPEVFVSLAEETGHIDALTRWVIDQAVAQMVAWRAATPGAGELDMHVNISARDLNRPGLVLQVGQSLARHGLAARDLTLEITETSLMGRLDTARDTLDALRRLGVRFSIDDFGTGYSSLAYLSKLPIDSLKIDRSFVQGMDSAHENVEIVRAVLNLGRTLGKKVIAEGVETAAQLATLKEMGVHVGQGYLLGRPMPPQQAQALLERTGAEMSS